MCLILRNVVYYTKEIMSPRYGYHCTTVNKLAKYKLSNRIIAPVRFWPSQQLAERWAKRTGRTILLKVKLKGISYPLPDHKPAMWCPLDVTDYEIVTTT